MKKLKYFIFPAFLLMTATVVIADANSMFVGKVQLVGNRVNQKVLLKNMGVTNEICSGSQSRYQLSQLSGMKVEVNGKNKSITNKKGRSKTCIEASNFKILQTSTGKRALIGILEKAAGQYLLVSPQGKFELSNALPGLGEVVGRKIMVSIDPDILLSGKKAVKIHSFMKFPKSTNKGDSPL